MIVHTCKSCGIEYQAKKKGQKFCSVKCKGASRSKEKRVTLTCKGCGKEFDTPACRVKVNRQFCSSECQSRFKEAKISINACELCSKEFRVRPCEAQQRFCSVECRGLATRNREELTCKNCGEKFWVSISKSKKNRQFCSQKCRQFKIMVTCLCCGKEFDLRPCEIKNRKYCSRKCRDKAKVVRVSFICETCSTEFLDRPNRKYHRTRKFCSFKCSVVASRMERITIECQNCGKALDLTTTAAQSRKYCSFKCMGEAYQKQVILTCKTCGVEFSDTESGAATRQYCSKPCYDEGRKKLVEVTCEICCEDFYLTPSLTKGRKYCSMKCLFKSLENKIIISCAFCGKEVELPASRSDSKYCSHECYSKSMEISVGKSCELCGSEFFIRPSQYEGRRFCSVDCRIRSKLPTDLEIFCYKAFEGIGLIENEDFIFQYPYPGTRYILDFYFPAYGMVIEANGEYWHSDEATIQKDTRRKKYLEDEGLVVREWWGSEIKDSLAALVERDILPLTQNNHLT
jgi:hypothetical protein